ncbi:MAG: hypothetical protein P8Y03_30620 [Anaerolineales bacterium]|jgi:hypothetical protein
MNKKSPSRHPRRFALKDLKWLILTLAVTCALVYWALFSNKIGEKGLATASGNDQVPGSVPPVETEAQMVIDLPPLPTLIPTLDPSLAEQLVQPVPSQNSVSDSATPVQPPVKIFIGGAKPSTKKVTTVTVTRSSR